MGGLPAVFFFSSRRRHTRSYGDWSSDVCSSDLRLHDSPDPERERFPVLPQRLRRWAGLRQLRSEHHAAGAQRQRSEERRVGKGWKMEFRTGDASKNMEGMSAAGSLVTGRLTTAE